MYTNFKYPAFSVIDERRIALLEAKFGSQVVASSSLPSNRGTEVAALGLSSGSTVNKTVTAKTEPVYAGGIYSRLEAQFRAQQTAKALALQGAQTRYTMYSVNSREIIVSNVRFGIVLFI